MGVEPNVPTKQSPPAKPSPPAKRPPRTKKSLSGQESPPTGESLSGLSGESFSGEQPSSLVEVSPLSPLDQGEVGPPDLDALSHRDRPSRPETAADLAAVHARVRLAAAAALDLKAEDVKILEMHELITYTDYLLLCTGRNVRQTKRIAEEIAFRLKQESGVIPAGVEGTAGNEWILLDFLDFIVHVFTPEARAFYRLDVLWKQAPVEVVE